MSIDMASIHQAFFEETGELLDGFEQHILELEDSPEDFELLNSIFRCAHSVKGGSSTFGFPELARFTHELETLLDLVRNKKVGITKPLCKLMLDSSDQMRTLLELYREGATDLPPSDALISRITAAAKGELTEGGTEASVIEHEPEDASLFELTFRPHVDSLRNGRDPLKAIEQLYQIADVLTVEANTTNLPGPDQLTADDCLLSWVFMIQTHASEAKLFEAFGEYEQNVEICIHMLGGFLDEPAPVQSATAVVTAEPGQKANPSPSQNKEGSTIKVSSEKLDTLINLVGELVINQSMLNATTEGFTIDKLPQLTEAVASMERASRELQERVMAIRLLQMKIAFGRFPRLVHDLSLSVGKKVNLVLNGSETELDKNLIEAIADPLTHLVRNSVDHGLETPQERESAGKNPIGTLTLTAAHEGGSIVIEISDDGKGLNREAILAKAVERGVVQADETLTDDQVYNLIFLPGFSTAKEVTDLSGRGVGMDIVKQSIAAIGGSVKVTSRPGQGVTTRIRLPLTMAILEGQSMAVGDGVYVVPLTSIIESLRPTKEEVHSLGEAGEVVAVRGEYIPLLRLYEAFNLVGQATDPWEASLVLVESEGRKVALMADELLGQGQVVIKSLETNYRRVEGIAGATILGDGRVALILDIPGLIKGIEKQKCKSQVAA